MEWFIQLHRQMLEWEWYDDINTKVLFIHLLIKANWKTKKWRWIEIERWEVLTSLRNLSNETWLSLQQVRTSIKNLKSTHDITHEWHASYTIIKVINYDTYQSNNTESNKPVTSNQQTDNKQVTTTNKDNKDNKENKEIIIKEKTPVSLINIAEKEFTNEFIEKMQQKYNLNSDSIKKQQELFLIHWTAPKNTRKWEVELWSTKETFDIKRRFYTWLNNNETWNKSSWSYNSNTQAPWITTI